VVVRNGWDWCQERLGWGINAMCPRVEVLIFKEWSCRVLQLCMVAYICLSLFGQIWFQHLTGPQTPFHPAGFYYDSYLEQSGKDVLVRIGSSLATCYDTATAVVIIIFRTISCLGLSSSLTPVCGTWAVWSVVAYALLDCQPTACGCVLCNPGVTQVQPGCHIQSVAVPLISS
jgi:hypothetical protein